jgi:hypothetical protein
VLRNVQFVDISNLCRRINPMVNGRAPHKVERVRITFIPTTDEASYRNIPSTFSPSSRTYNWKKTTQMEYLIVPKKISSDEIVVEMFVETKKGRGGPAQLQKVIQNLVNSKIHSEWHGLKLGGISRATNAVPPAHRVVRGTIEEILGSRLERE